MTVRFSFASLLLLTACGSPALLGETCVDDSDCADELRCFASSDAEDAMRRCMEGCDPTTTVTCADGTVCLPEAMAAATEGVCWLGEGVPDGGPCATVLECAAGLICIDQAGALACRPACDVTLEGADCGAGLGCFTAGSPASPDLGFCLAD
jgi:hypothetical protein